MACVSDYVEFECDDEISDFVRSMTTVHIDDKDLPLEQINKQLKRLHCPFTWKPSNDSNNRDLLNATEEKLCSVDDECEELAAWTKFVLNLILCYEYTKSGDLQYAMDKQEECDEIINSAPANDGSTPLMGIGLKHVSVACKIYLLLKSKLFDEAMDNLRNTPDIENMTSEDQATIWSVRGALLLEYGFKGMKESVPFIEKALELNAECGEWHFLLGKALSRVRRIEDRTAIPDKRELKAFERAVSLSQNTFYMVLLAQSYSDTARLVYWKMGNKSDALKSLCNAMNENASEMYKNAVDNCKENPYVLGRCAYGLMRFPPPWRDMVLAENCISRGLVRSSNNSFLNNTAAAFYKNKKDFDKAKYYFNRSAESGNYSACLEMLDIKQKENKSYNPVSDLERYIERFKVKAQQEHLVGLLGAFYYFVEDDFNKALNCWLQIIENNIESIVLKELKNPWPKSPNPCNVSKTIINEIIIRLNKGTCSEEERVLYEKVLDKYRGKHIGLVKSIEGVYAERSRYKDWCSSEQRNVPATSKVWDNMSRNAVGKHWKASSDNHGERSDWRKNN